MKKFLNFCIIAVFFITACTQPEAATQETAENMPVAQESPAASEARATDTETEEIEMQANKVAVVIARDRYQSLEYNPVVDQLKAAGHEIVIMSDDLGMAAGTQESTEVEMTFTDANTAELKAIVLIGGSNSLWKHAELHALLNKMQAEGKLVSGICYGSVTLAEAGVVGEGDTACWFNSAESDPVMQSFGVVDSTQDVTINGNIITGDGPDSAEEFAEAVAEYLGK